MHTHTCMLYGMVTTYECNRKTNPDKYKSFAKMDVEPCQNSDTNKNLNIIHIHTYIYNSNLKYGWDWRLKPTIMFALAYIFKLLGNLCQDENSWMPRKQARPCYPWLNNDGLFPTQSVCVCVCGFPMRWGYGMRCTTTNTLEWW